MEERLFIHLLRNEPTAVELTKKQYDDHRAFEQLRGSGKDAEDVKGVLEEDPGPEQDAAPLSGENTKKEIIAELVNRGFINDGKLQRKTKAQLLELL